MNLTKAQLSLNLNVSDITIYLWEHNRVQPSVVQIPKIIEFLGRDPFEIETKNLGERIREYRRVHGLTQKKFAAQLEVDQTTLAGWEKEAHKHSKKMVFRLDQYHLRR